MLEKYTNGDIDSDVIVRLKEESLSKDTKINDLNQDLEQLQKQVIQAKDEVK